MLTKTVAKHWAIKTLNIGDWVIIVAFETTRIRLSIGPSAAGAEYRDYAHAVQLGYQVF